MRVLLNSQGYSYDVHSLVKAFYSDEDVEIVTEDSGEQWNGYKVEVSSGDIAKDSCVSGTIKCSYIGSDGTTVCEQSQYTEASRSEVKTELKLCLYRLLNKITHIELPWGTLTGIRPTKIPMKMILEGATDSEISRYMKDRYLCTNEKIGLATEIAHRESSLLESLPKDGYSLYIGIPFCPTTCLYCSFTSYPIVSWKKRTGEYLSALKKELDYVSKLTQGRKPDTIYIGGGTPTTLEPNELEQLIQYIQSDFSLDNIKEFTVEAGRPDSITLDKLKVLKDYGITRLSINPQTMNDKTLKVIGRQHSVSQVYDAYELARRVGFDNINMDLILGLPGESIEDVRYTCNEVKRLAPDSLTVHSMAIKRAAGMHRFLEEHDEYKSENTPEMMELVSSTAKDIGLLPYYLYRQKNMSGNFENVGYAAEGKFGIYNILIMEEVQDIIACGAGTVTKRIFAGDRIERCDNVKDVNLYINSIDEMIERKKNLFSL